MGAAFDLNGEPAARVMLPIMLILGAVFFVVTIYFPESFLPFVLYEGIAMLCALGIYVLLYYRGELPGAGWMALGVFVTILAAVVQAVGKKGKSMVWYFDNNGVFHLVQMVGLALMFRGLQIL